MLHRHSAVERLVHDNPPSGSLATAVWDLDVGDCVGCGLHVARAAGRLNTWRMEGLGIRWNFLEFPGRSAEDELRHAISHALPSPDRRDGSAYRPQIAPHGCVPWCRDAEGFGCRLP